MPPKNLIDKILKIVLFSKRHDVDVNVMIYRKNDNSYYLSLGIDDLDIDKPIYYCPMCGRKLDEDRAD